MVKPAFQSLWTLPCWGSALVSALSKPGESPCWESVKENTEKTCKIKIDTCDMWEAFSCVLRPAWNVRVYSLHFQIFWWSWDHNFAVCIRDQIFWAANCTMKTLGKSASYRVIQLGVLSAGKVKPRQLRSFRNDWMSFSRFWTKLFLGTHPHNFLTGWNARYCKKRLNSFALHTYRRTKPFWEKWFILSHELMWRQPLTLYNFSQKWMQVQNHAVEWAN